jgi:hypothetical protein
MRVGRGKSGDELEAVECNFTRGREKINYGI